MQSTELDVYGQAEQEFLQFKHGPDVLREAEYNKCVIGSFMGHSKEVTLEDGFVFVKWGVKGMRYLAKRVVADDSGVAVGKNNVRLSFDCRKGKEWWDVPKVFVEEVELQGRRTRIQDSSSPGSGLTEHLNPHVFLENLGFIPVLASKKAFWMTGWSRLKFDPDPDAKHHPYVLQDGKDREVRVTAELVQDMLGLKDATLSYAEGKQGNFVRLPPGSRPTDDRSEQEKSSVDDKAEDSLSINPFPIRQDSHDCLLSATCSGIYRYAAHVNPTPEKGPTNLMRAIVYIHKEAHKIPRDPEYVGAFIQFAKRILNEVGYDLHPVEKYDPLQGPSPIYPVFGMPRLKNKNWSGHVISVWDKYIYEPTFHLAEDLTRDSLNKICGDCQIPGEFHFFAWAQQLQPLKNKRLDPDYRWDPDNQPKKRKEHNKRKKRKKQDQQLPVGFH